MPVPDFSPGEVLTSAAMDSIGLWLVKSQAVGSGVSSVTLTDVFSADYDNYKILYSGGTQTANTALQIILGASTTGYYGFMNYGDTSIGAAFGASQSNSATFKWIGGGKGGFASHGSVELYNPFKAGYTTFAHGTYQNDPSYGTVQGEHRVATSYTAFTLSPETGTISGGTVRVYGYRN
jgi:hypothetical protein